MNSVWPTPAQASEPVGTCLKQCRKLPTCRIFISSSVLFQDGKLSHKSNLNQIPKNFGICQKLISSVQVTEWQMWTTVGRSRKGGFHLYWWCWFPLQKLCVSLTLALSPHPSPGCCSLFKISGCCPEGCREVGSFVNPNRLCQLTRLCHLHVASGS